MDREIDRKREREIEIDREIEIKIFYLKNYYPPGLGQHNTIRRHRLEEG